MNPLHRVEFIHFPNRSRLVKLAHDSIRTCNLYRSTCHTIQLVVLSKSRVSYLAWSMTVNLTGSCEISKRLDWIQSSGLPYWERITVPFGAVLGAENENETVTSTFLSYRWYHSSYKSLSTIHFCFAEKSVITWMPLLGWFTLNA